MPGTDEYGFCIGVVGARNLAHDAHRGIQALDEVLSMVGEREMVRGVLFQKDL